MSTNILRKFFSFSIGTWIGAIIGIVTIPLITNFFSPDDLGKAAMFALALNVMMVITMFGIDQTFVRFYYEEKTNLLLSKSLIITFLFTCAIFLVFYFLRVKISVYLFDIYVPEMMVLLCIATIVSILNSYAVQIIRMDQKGLLYSSVQVALRLFELLFILVLFYFFRSNYKVLIYAKALALFVVTVYAMFATRSVWNNLHIKPPQSVYSFNDIFLYSYPLALTMFITWAFQSFDKIALKQWSSVYELGIYTAAFRIVLILQIVQTSFTTYWIPLSYEKFIKNDDEAANKVFFSKANSLISAIMLVAGVGLILTKDLVTFILGPQYKDAVTMIPCLVLVPVLFTISESTVIGINFYKKVKTVFLISVITLISNIIGNYFLVPKFNGIGAAIAGGISAIVFFSLRTIFSLKYYKVDYNILKFYLLLFLVFGYALYSTFAKWNIYNALIGVALILLIFWLYFRNLKDLIDRLMIFRKFFG
jgi:O-antigen/teichoic acid export membrane protein